MDTTAQRIRFRNLSLCAEKQLSRLMHKNFDNNHPFLWKGSVLSASKYTNEMQSDQIRRFECLIGRMFDLMSLLRNAWFECGSGGPRESVLTIFAGTPSGSKLNGRRMI